MSKGVQLPNTVKKDSSLVWKNYFLQEGISSLTNICLTLAETWSITSGLWTVEISSSFYDKDLLASVENLRLKKRNRWKSVGDT